MNAAGLVVWEAGYMPFGEARIVTAGIENNLRFPGQYHDAETGLHYNFHRYYNPATGRYITADPIGLEGGINLYAYCLNDPVNRVDLEGELGVLAGIAIGAAIAVGVSYVGAKLAASVVNKDAQAGVDMAMGKVAQIRAGEVASAAAGEVAGAAIGAGLRRATTCASKSGKPGSYVPDRTLPTDKYGVPTSDVDVPHSQLGRSKPKYGSEPQARTWDYGENGKLQPQHDIDFTDHGYPDAHPDVPHKHVLTPNNPKLAPKGGYQRWVSKREWRAFMMYWIRDEDTTPQRFPLKKMIQLIVQKLGIAVYELWILRADGYGLTIGEWDDLLDKNDRIKVGYDLLENISSGTEEWFYDLESQIVTADGLQVRFGLHDSTALFIDAPKEFSESIIKSFENVQERI